MRQPLIAVADVPSEGVAEVEFFGRELLVVRDGDDVKAFANVCPHIGGPLKRCHDKLVCQWHGAEFDAKTGRRLAGPPRPDAELMSVPTEVVEDVLTYVWEES